MWNSRFLLSDGAKAPNKKKKKKKKNETKRLLLSIFLGEFQADLSLANAAEADDHEPLLFRLCSDGKRRQTGFLKSLADIPTPSKFGTDSMRNKVMLILDSCTFHFGYATKSISLVYRRRYGENLSTYWSWLTENHASLAFD